MKIVLLALLILTVILQYKLWFTQSGLPSVFQLKSEVYAEREKNETLKNRNLALEAEVNDLKKGYSAIEERARNDLGMIKEDETFYRIIEKH